VRAGALVGSVSRCGEVPSSAIQLAVIGTLLAFATSPAFGLHGDALSHAMRTLLHMSIAAATEGDQTTAKTALVQLINTVFKRAEPFFTSDGGATTGGAIATNGGGGGGGGSGGAASVGDAVDANGGGGGGASDGATVAAVVTVAGGASTSREYPVPVSDALLLVIVLCKIAAKEVEGTGTPASDVYKAHSKVLALDLLRQLLEGPSAAVWLATLHGPLRQPLGVALLRAGAGLGGDIPVDEGVFGVTGGGGNNGNSNGSGIVNSGGGGGRGGGGGGGKSGDSRIFSPAVLKAGSPLPALARAAFGTLVLRARAPWKSEVSVLFPLLALTPLESSGASPGSQLVALRLIRKLSSDPQVLVDLFVNYDCDMAAANLYERTVAALAGVMRPGPGVAQQVRNGAVQCMLAIVQSLRTWHAKGEGSEGELGGSGGGGSMELSPAAVSSISRTASGRDDVVDGEEIDDVSLAAAGGGGKKSSREGYEPPSKVPDEPPSTPSTAAEESNTTAAAAAAAAMAAAAAVTPVTPGSPLTPLSESQRFQMAKAGPLCKLNTLDPSRLKLPGFNPRAYEVNKKLVSKVCAFKFNVLYRLRRGSEGERGSRGGVVQPQTLRQIPSRRRGAVSRGPGPDSGRRLFARG
jgi:hypothetical protein